MSDKPTLAESLDAMEDLVNGYDFLGTGSYSDALLNAMEAEARGHLANLRTAVALLTPERVARALLILDDNDPGILMERGNEISIDDSAALPLATRPPARRGGRVKRHATPARAPWWLLPVAVAGYLGAAALVAGGVWLALVLLFSMAPR